MRLFLGVVSLNLGSKGSVNENFLLGGRNEIGGASTRMLIMSATIVSCSRKPQCLRLKRIATSAPLSAFAY